MSLNIVKTSTFHFDTNGLILKSFDTVKWEFLKAPLKAFAFVLQLWISILYNIKSCVTNNGHSSNYFNLPRGIKQGWSISSLLFSSRNCSNCTNLENDKGLIAKSQSVFFSCSMISILLCFSSPIYHVLHVQGTKNKTVF